MNTQPYNSMIPAVIQTPHGSQQGMTLEDAKRVYAEPGDLSDWLNVLNLGSACYILGYDAEAFEEAARAVDMFPCAATYINLAVIFGSRGQFAEAMYAARQAHESEPGNRTAATLYAESLLRAGRWDAGWPLFHNYYDSNRVSLFRHAIPEWNSEPLKGKHLLVIEGGGFGDNLFFARWLPLLKQLGAHITYLCPASLCSLMSAQPYIDVVIPTQQGEAEQLDIRGFDYFVPLLALGEKLRARPTTEQVPYIHSGAYDANTKGRIGFCWQAAEAHLPRPFRSLDKVQQRQITSAMGDAKVVSLVLQDWNRNLGWDVTARHIASCEKVITVDTGVAHLSAAMGVPTWVILPGLSAWYYGLNSLTLPLYPSMRLFRNHVRGLDIAVSACIKALEAGA